MRAFLNGYNKTKSFFNRTEKFAYPVVLCLILSIVLGGLFYQKTRLTRNQGYTIGIVKKYSFGSHNAKYVDYNFEVNETNYMGRVDFYKALGQDIIGWKFVVAFDLVNPNTSTIFYHLPVDSTAKLGTKLYKNPPDPYN